MALGASAQEVGFQGQWSASAKKAAAKMVLKATDATKVSSSSYAVSPSMSFQKAAALRKSPLKAGTELSASYLMPDSVYYGGIMHEGKYFMYNSNYPFMYSAALRNLTFTAAGYDKNTPATFEWTFAEHTLTTSTAQFKNIGMFYYDPVLTITQNGVASTYYPVNTADGKEYKGLWNAGTDSIADFDVYDAVLGEGPYKGFNDGPSFDTNAEFNSTGKKMTGFVAVMPTVGDSLYVYGNHIILLANDTTFLTTLAANPITLKLCTMKDGTLTPFKTATLSRSDVSIHQSSSYYWVGLNFKFKDVDPLLGETDAPFTLPNEDVYAVYSGFDKFSTTFTGMFYSAGGKEGNAYALLSDGSISTVGYSNEPSVPQCLFLTGWTGVIPVAESAMEPGTVIDIPTAGGNGVTQIKDGQSYNDYDIYTVTKAETDYTPWIIESKPDWVDVTFKDFYPYADDPANADFFGNAIMLFAKADALPSGSEGRGGNIVLSLYGKRLVIPVKQGVYDGIKSVNNGKAVAPDTKTFYNILGQRTNKGAKGILISAQGAKFLNK